jgi:valyl-tRNA synthetase
MSKSKGNTIDPLDLIDGITLDELVKKSTSSLLLPQVREKVEKRIRKDYPDGIAAVGTDALRFTFAALATYGRTINFDLKRAEGYKAFCNKLWNAARFVLMNIESAPKAAPQPLTEAERWIVARLRATLAEIETQMKLYRFDLVAQALYEFVWNDYCDWFVELAKPALSGTDKAAAESTRHTLLTALEAALRALHPITPFITEEIFQSVAPLLGLKETSITQRRYPRADDFPADDAAASADIEWLRAVITQVRRIRSELNVSPAKQIELLLDDGNELDRERFEKFGNQIFFILKIDSAFWLDESNRGARGICATGIAGDLKLLVPMEGLIDMTAERSRLDKEIKRLEGEIAKSSAKLANFGVNTPATVIEQEKQRVAERSVALNGLREQAQRLANVQ